MSGQSLQLTQGMTSFHAAGIPVILRDTEKNPDISGEIVALSITAHGGVVISPKAGALDLMSDLMLKGTYRYTKEQIDALLHRTGTSLSVSANYDDISVNVKTLKQYLPEILPLISELIRVPLFDAKELQLAKDQLETELKGEVDHPDSLLALLMHENYYKGHPYFNRPSGFLTTVKTVTRDDLSNALNKTFNKGNVFITVVGDLTADDVKALVETHFSTLPSGSRAADLREAPKNSTNIVHFKKFEAPTSYFQAKFKGPSLDSPDYPALSIGLQILDRRLFDEVRTKRGLAYAVSAGIGLSKVNSGTLYVTSPNIQEAVQVILDEVRRIQNKELSQEEISDQVNKFLSTWYAGREARGSQARVFSMYEVMGIGWENSDSYMSRLERVTPQQVKEALNKYLVDMTFGVVGSTDPNLLPTLKAAGFAS